jgi:hypothetical protein
VIIELRLAQDQRRINACPSAGVLANHRLDDQVTDPKPGPSAFTTFDNYLDLRQEQQQQRGMAELRRHTGAVIGWCASRLLQAAALGRVRSIPAAGSS